MIGAVSDKWSGGLPFTIYFGKDGTKIYAEQGIIKPEVLTPKIDASLEIKECKPEDSERP